MNETEEKITMEMEYMFERVKPRIFEGVLNSSEAKIGSAIRPQIQNRASRILGLSLASLCLIAGIYGFVDLKHPSGISGSVSQSVASSNHDTLHFNEVSQGNQTVASFKTYSKFILWSDIIKEFGTNPLDEVWVPQGLSVQIGSNDNNSRAVYGDHSKTDLYFMDVFYSSEPGRNPSKSVDIMLQHENTLQFEADIWSTGVVRKSQINGTDVTLMHVTGNTDGEQFNGEYYSAEFIWRHIRYEVGSAGVSKDDFIHVLTSIIR